MTEKKQYLLTILIMILLLSIIVWIHRVINRKFKSQALIFATIELMPIHTLLLFLLLIVICCIPI